MKIYFVRHGETDMNARNMFYGWYDADINEKGIAQAEELRAAFETIHIDAIYSSDLKRAYHTAHMGGNVRSGFRGMAWLADRLGRQKDAKRGSLYGIL